MLEKKDDIQNKINGFMGKNAKTQGGEEEEGEAENDENTFKLPEMSHSSGHHS